MTTHLTFAAALVLLMILLAAMWATGLRWSDLETEEDCYAG